MRALEHIVERLTVNEVHLVIDGTVLLEQVVNVNNMWVMQLTQPLGFLAELIFLCIEVLGVVFVGHAHTDGIANTFVDTPHKELLDGYLLIELCISSHIGIAEASRCQVALNTELSTLQQGADGQHGTGLDGLTHRLYKGRQQGWYPAVLHEVNIFYVFLLNMEDWSVRIVTMLEHIVSVVFRYNGDAQALARCSQDGAI